MVKARGSSGEREQRGRRDGAVYDMKRFAMRVAYMHKLVGVRGVGGHCSRMVRGRNPEIMPRQG
jgi:hypothetical protein